MKGAPIPWPGESPNEALGTKVRARTTKGRLATHRDLLGASRRRHSIRGGPCLPTLTLKEQGDRPADAPLTGLRTLGRVDVVNVVPLKAVGQIVEKAVHRLVLIEGSFEVGWHLDG